MKRRKFILWLGVGSLSTACYKEHIVDSLCDYTGQVIGLKVLEEKNKDGQQQLRITLRQPDKCEAYCPLKFVSGEMKRNEERIMQWVDSIDYNDPKNEINELNEDGQIVAIVAITNHPVEIFAIKWKSSSGGLSKEGGIFFDFGSEKDEVDTEINLIPMCQYFEVK